MAFASDGVLLERPAGFPLIGSVDLAALDAAGGRPVATVRAAPSRRPWPWSEMRIKVKVLFLESDFAVIDSRSVSVSGLELWARALVARP